MRPISPGDFNRILSLGFDEREPELPRIGEPEIVDQARGFGEQPQSLFSFQQERDRVTQLTSRIVRNRLFRRLVLKA
ncbi:hypothetical protein USDA257_p00180 (plasmid) [Sinorhizobium fredii USDA 257]|uniref:Uncharacterized protein n=1 Tax=Sinorhizobium fredii (strain USDA 257) TaxID=1185652 RepID=I3XFT1_SINF2|nr:hypothetical protein USDA257_p00180 [Sinorhizobium fredii USDA 257]